MAMPKLPFETMAGNVEDGSEGRDGRMILAARNKRTGCLRASKPFPKIDFNGDEERALFEGSANYVGGCCVSISPQLGPTIVYRSLPTGTLVSFIGVGRSKAFTPVIGRGRKRRRNIGKGWMQ